MLKKSLLAATVAALAVSAPALAHNQWFLPSTTVVSDTKQYVSVDAGASTEPFIADHNAMNVDNVKVWAPDGSEGKLENAAKGRYRSTFDVAIDKPGTWRIGSASSSVGGTFKLNGEDWMVGRRRGPPPAAAGAPGAVPAAMTPPAPPAGAGAPAGGPGGRPRIDPSHIVATVEEIPAGATDLDLTESHSRNEFFVTAGEPTEASFTPTNKGLEMVPVTLPGDLVSNEPGKFRYLIDGKPAVGLEVEVIPGGARFRDSDDVQRLKTGADGVLSVTWPVPGYYWVCASLTDDKPSVPKASKRRMSHTMTLEVLAP